jgi:hypothetical protein
MRSFPSRLETPWEATILNVPTNSESEQECRSLAESAQNPLNAASYLKLADLYEVLAQEEEKLSVRYPSEG